jgi:membrane protease YdiL (CAAX protease family)
VIVVRGMVIALGVVAEAAAWAAVSWGRRSVWRTLPPVLGVMALAALLVAPAREPDVGRAAAFGVGAASGVALFVATRVFVAVASRWEPFRRHTADSYTLATSTSLPAALALSLLVTVPAEELFWRGLAAPELGGTSLTLAGGAAVAWALYVGANVPSRSLAILAGAAVGGAVWAWLGWWSGGVLAPLASHILWTGPMLVFPPGAGRKAATT